MTYFQNHPQRYTQHRYPRRGGGYTAPQITLHTYEAPHTRSLQDAARWLTQRRDPGSYHALVGAKGPRDVLLLAPWSHETWHSVPSNNWAIGISAVAYAHQWKTIPRAAADNLVKSMAHAASLAAKWLEQAHGRKVEPRVLTRAQAMRKESGFVTHATMDPGRRSDPGPHFPMGDFLAEFNRLMAGAPTPAPTPTPSEEDDMPLTNDDVRKIWAYRNPDAYPLQVFRMLREIHSQTGQGAGERAGLLEAITQLAGGSGSVDVAAVASAAQSGAQAGVQAALDSVEADVRLTIDTHKPTDDTEENL